EYVPVGSSKTSLFLKVPESVTAHPGSHQSCLHGVRRFWKGFPARPDYFGDNFNLVEYLG
ncbi:hypothetical protein, partial [Marinobacter sp. OP 3.4]|uniref:hypothetical protein n=1 Tax=Marinobacter sp. OP 3.4 TaxID=3076501 RepID=UPI002E1EB2EF